MYRLYAVANHGRKYQSTYYFTASFKIHYGLTENSVIAYEENGQVRLFEGNQQSNWNTIIKRIFQTPFVARVVRFQVITGHYPPVAMEFYGCKIFDNTHATYIHSKYQESIQAAPELSDGDLSTLIPVPINDHNKYIISVSHTESLSNIDILLKFRLNVNCDLSDLAVLMYVHHNAALFEFDVGDYDLCQMNDMGVEYAVHSYMYSCQCVYGLCEHAMLTVFTNRDVECASLLEIEVM